MNFSGRELRDLLVAWLALGLAFAFFEHRVSAAAFFGALADPAFHAEFALSLATVGVAFLVHELAHKVVAVRFGQHAEFRADFGMLALAVASGLAGFLFAAAGAVHHRGRITLREHGLIAVAGPLTNVALAVVSIALLPVVPDVATRGLFINALLAAFNLIPFGPLDGSTVLKWSKAAWVLSVGAAACSVAAWLVVT